jgi:hypothetical protein
MLWERCERARNWGRIILIGSCVLWAGVDILFLRIILDKNKWHPVSANWSPFSTKPIIIKNLLRQLSRSLSSHKSVLKIVMFSPFHVGCRLDGIYMSLWGHSWAQCPKWRPVFSWRPLCGTLCPCYMPTIAFDTVPKGLSIASTRVQCYCHTADGGSRQSQNPKL